MIISMKFMVVSIDLNVHIEPVQQSELSMEATSPHSEGERSSCFTPNRVYQSIRHTC